MASSISTHSCGESESLSSNHWKMLRISSNSQHKGSRERKPWLELLSIIEKDRGILRLTSIQLETMLKQLMAIITSKVYLQPEEMTSMLASLAQVIPPTSGVLCYDYVCLVQECCMRKQANFFTLTELTLTLRFLIHCLCSGASFFAASSLYAIELVLADNAKHVQLSDCAMLLNVLIKYMDPSGVNVHARYTATNCLYSLFSQATSMQELQHYVRRLVPMLVENVRQQSQLLTQRAHEDSILIRALSFSLKFIVSSMSISCKTVMDEVEAQLPALVHCLPPIVGCGLDTVFEAKNLASRFQHTSSCLVAYGMASSGGRSEYMNEKSSLPSAHVRMMHRPRSLLLQELRHVLLSVLEALTQKFPDAMLPNVCLFLPEQSQGNLMLDSNTASILTLMIMDPCLRIRQSAARIVEVVFDRLSLKELYFRSGNILKSRAFPMAPRRLSIILYHVHAALIHCLTAEKEASVKIQLLKAATAVAVHCPHWRVQNELRAVGLGVSFSDLIKLFLYSVFSLTASAKENAVRAAGYVCFAAALNIQDPSSIVSQFLMTEPHQFRSVNVGNLTLKRRNSSGTVDKPLIHLLLVNARTFELAHGFCSRVEAISLLLKISRNHASVLSECWQYFADFLLVSLRDKDANTRVQAVKCLEMYVKTEIVRLEPENVAKLAEEQRRYRSNSTGTMLSTRTWSNRLRAGSVGALTQFSHHDSKNWEEKQRRSALESKCLDFMIFELLKALKDPSQQVRAGVCVCFTLWRPQDWVYVKARIGSCASEKSVQWEECMRTIMDTVSDSSPVVRAAGFRLLGSMSLAPAHKSAELTEALIMLALDAMSDTTLNVRVRAAWALGNACTTPGPERIDAELSRNSSGSIRNPLSFSSSNEEINLCQLISIRQMQNVAEKMLQWINENDKVASSAARTMGLVCRWFAYEPLKHGLSTKEIKALDDLLHQVMIILSAKVNAGSPKLRWNACHAMAKILSCPRMAVTGTSWTTHVLKALIDAVIQQENFKVRISASGALRVLSARDAYGGLYLEAVRATADALETASDLKELTEYKYKEQLESQLSFTLIHLIHIAEAVDHTLLYDVFSSKPSGFLFDWLFHNLHRMLSVFSSNDSVCKMHSLSPIENDSAEIRDECPVQHGEMLNAVQTLLDIVLHFDPHRLRIARGCLPILYNAKSMLEGMHLNEASESGHGMLM